MNVENIDGTLVKTITSSEAGLISFDGYFGYLLVFIVIEHSHKHLTY